MTQKYFITAIDTDSGKTLVSAIFCEALAADYWKPIQSGEPSDSDTIKVLVSNPEITIHPEAYRLKTPASPHAAAKIDNIIIDLQKLELPQTYNNLIVEGAGGVLVPINEDEFIIDLICKFNFKLILVADLYLGSINHTLLTIEALKNRNVDILGIVFNGDSNPESERIILKHSGLRKLLHIKKESEITKETVLSYAKEVIL